MNKRKRATIYSKEMRAKSILLIVDVLSIFISLLFGFVVANILNIFTGFSSHQFLNSSTSLYVFYLIIPLVFFSEGIYTHRFDFWHELRLILRGLVLSFIIILAYLALTKNMDGHSRAVIILSFLFMAFVIPIMKLIVKNKMFKLGLWKIGVKILDNNADIEKTIFNDPYTGYIKSKRATTSFVFLNSQQKDISLAKKQLEEEISSKHKVMFLPFFNNYKFSSSDIFELDRSRTNLIVLENKLNSKYRMFVNITYNYIVAILSLPLLLPIIGIIAFLIKRDSNGPVFFMQDRLGVDGKIFKVFKFRTMLVDGDEVLEKYLQDNPQEVENYKVFCKYDNDPRITKIGNFLRNTSADELAQIFNVLRGEMNFVGPRPYLVTELDKIGKENANIILKVKPGITGLWQVSGRSDITFQDRVNMDKWYIYNWSLWDDFVILLKTFSVVLKKSGAK